MTSTPASAEPAARGRDAGYSLRYRLPLLIFGLLAVLGTSFAWMAYREAKLALIASGGDRLATAGRQIADLLGQATSARLAETRRLAAAPGVRAFVATHRPEDSADLPEALRSFVDRNPLTTLWLCDAGGAAIAALARGTGAPPTDASRLPPAAPGVGPLRSDDGRVWYLTTVPVSGSGAPDRLIAVQRSLGSAQVVMLIERLIGSGATLKLGNASHDTWTDLSKPVAAPPTTAPGTPTVYRPADGGPRIGTALQIPNTPWLLWVEVPEASVLGPATALLRRMLPVAVVLTAVGALAAAFLSRRIVRPLEQLADVSEAIAAGDLAKRIPVSEGRELGRLGSAFNLMAQHMAESHRQLEARVAERTRELETARSELETSNRELESFSYSVSHDLRAPLRTIDGFAQALVEDYHSRLDDTGRDYLARIRRGAQRMGLLIDDLLSLSRVSRGDLTRGPVDLSQLVRDAAARVREQDPERAVAWRIQPDVIADGDARLLQIAIDNLIDNAWKFTARCERAVVEFDVIPADGGGRAFRVRDNGAGFDMAYADKLFGAFQRLHGVNEFAGTGIGLATVQRIVRRHGGRVWAEGTVDGGAAFYFTLEAE